MSSPRGVVVVGGCVHREGLALLVAAQGRLCDNGASPPGWCDARRARRAGAVNGVGGEGCGQALVLADDEDARRMLWYAAFLKPLRDRCAVASAADGGRRDDDEDEDDAGGGGAGPIPPTTKRANRSAVSVLLVDELKRPARDAEAVERIMKAADGFTGLVSRGGDVSALPVLLSGARVFRAAASGKDDYDDDEIPAGGGDRREGGEGGGAGVSYAPWTTGSSIPIPRTIRSGDTTWNSAPIAPKSSGMSGNCGGPPSSCRCASSSCVARITRSSTPAEVSW